MASKRSQIRIHLQSILTAAIPEVKGRVYPSRAAPIDDKNLPAILIYTRSESAEMMSVAPKQYVKKARTQIEIVAKGNETVDDILDDLADKVFKAVTANEKLGVVVGGTPATGSVTFTGTNGTVIPAGTILKRTYDASRYKTITAGTITGGAVTIATVQTVFTDRSGNSPAGDDILLITPIIGVSGNPVIASGGFVSGIAGTLVEAADDCVYVESNLDISAEGSQHIGACGVTFDVEYNEDGPDDQTADYPPLITIHAQYDLAPPDGTIDATDIINLEQPTP